MKKVEIQKLEMELLVEAIFKRYGYDFQEHFKAINKKARIYQKRV